MDNQNQYQYNTPDNIPEDINNDHSVNDESVIDSINTCKFLKHKSKNLYKSLIIKMNNIGKIIINNKSNIRTIIFDKSKFGKISQLFLVVYFTYNISNHIDKYNLIVQNSNISDNTLLLNRFIIVCNVLLTTLCTTNICFV